MSQDGYLQGSYQDARSTERKKNQHTFYTFISVHKTRKEATIFEDQKSRRKDRELIYNTPTDTV